MALGEAAAAAVPGTAAAFARGASGTSASRDDNNAQFFMDDDEETLSLLTCISTLAETTAAAAEVDWSERLQGLAPRLMQDYAFTTTSTATKDDTADPWTEWMATLHSLGRQQPGIVLFGNFQQASVQKLQVRLGRDKTNNNNTNTLPAAFDTPPGKIHIRAVTSVLQVNPLTAVQLTLSCLRSMARKEEENSDTSNSSSSSSSKNLQSLLGTTVLMEKVTEYYYRQQTARLAALAECLRIEQDETLSSSSSSNNHGIYPTIVAVLNAMDETYTVPYSSRHTNSNNSIENRGLFRLLLTAACRSHVNLQRQQLLPAGDLWQPSSSSSSSTSSSAAASAASRRVAGAGAVDPEQQQSTTTTFGALKDDKMAWDQFVRHAMERQRQVTLDGWQQALEALLVLLYQRTLVHASDFAMILTAFSYTSSSSSSRGGGAGAAFFSNIMAGGSHTQQHQQHFASVGLGEVAAHKKRLGQLAGLVCMECMSLWRAVDGSAPTNSRMDDTGGATSWIHTHPLLANLMIQGSSSSVELQNVAQSELQVLSSLLLRFGDVMDGSGSSSSCPESLALLSFGLLLQLAAAAVVGKDQATNTNASAPSAFWQNLGQAGMELSKLANGKCDAFGYLHETMLDLVLPPPLHPLDQETGGVEDQQQQDDTELGASCMIYASIGRELMAALFMTYHETMLSARHSSFAENLGIICNLIAVVYRNSSTLCQQFWADWDLYSSPEVPHTTGAGAPLCLVLEMAHGLAAKWLSNTRRAKNEKVLQAVSPLLKMVSSLVYNANVVEQVVVAFLPENLIRKSLAICSSDGLILADPTLYAHHRDSVMQSIARLVELGISSSCRAAFRQSLQAVEDQPGNSGPFLLFRVAAAGRGLSLSTSCRIISRLLQGAPTQWILQVCMALKSLQDVESAWRSSSGQAAFVSVIRGLVNHMSMVIFSPSVDDNTAVAFLEVLGNGLLTAAQLLPSSLSAISCPLLDGGDGATMSYRTAAVVMECLSNTLNNLLPVTKLHESPKVRTAAGEFASGLLGAILGSHEICNALFYYATCPVSLSVAGSLDEALRDVEVLQAMEEAEANSGSASTRAMWMMHHHSSTGDIDRGAFLRKALLESMSSIESLRLDLDGVQVRHWLNGEPTDALWHASRSAFGLLTDHMDGSLEVMIQSPHGLLATLPPVLRRHRDLSAAWASANVTYFELMLSLVNMDSDVADKYSVLPLNLLLSCVTLSQKTERRGDDWLHRLLFQSAAFHRVMSKSMHYAVALVKPGSEKSNNLKPEAAVASLRLVAACVKLSPSIASKLLVDSTGGTTVANLVTSFQEMVSTLDKSRSQVAVDPLSLVRGAKECLDILLTVWKYARYHGCEGFRGTVNFEAVADKESQFLTTLAMFVFGNTVRQVELGPGDSIPERRVKSSLLACASLAFEILGTELRWVLSRGEDTNISQTRIVKAIDSAMEGDPRLHLTGAYRHFGTVRSFPALVDQLGKCSSFLLSLRRSCISSPSELTLLFWKRDEADDFSSGQLAINRWLSSLERDAGTQKSTSQALAMFSATHGQLHGEIRRLTAWGNFLALYSGPLRKKRQLSGSGSSSIAIALVGEITGALERNVLALEIAKLESLDELPGAILAITGSAAASMLHCAFRSDVTDLKWDPKTRLEVLSSLATSNQKILTLLGSKEMYCHVVQKLLACALAISSAPVESRVDGQAELETINIELATTAVKVLRLLESISKTADWGMDDRKAYMSCFSTCVSLLSSICACASGRESYLSQLHGVLVVSSAVKSLIYQVSNLSSSGPSSDVVMSVLRFFQTLVGAGGARFLTHLVKDGAFGVLNICGSPVSTESAVGGVALRGYLPLSHGMQYDTAIGKDDPNHELFIASMLLLASSLWTASPSLLTGESTLRRVYFIASEYLSKHDKSIIGCLRQVITKSNARLTVRVLREAAAVLSVISALCGKDAVDLFKRSHPHLYRDLLDEVRAVARAICCYLGASGASRELFKGLDAEDSGATNPTSFAGLSPMFDILANGVSNAKHEAIRFSLFASHSSSAITNDEHKAQSDYPISWAPRARSASMENNPKSESSLEQSSRSVVTCAFAFLLEKEASSCLFHSINIIWKTHPSASSFVTFSPEESTKLDGLSMVKTGMVIAFRSINESRRLMSQRDYDTNKQHSDENQDPIAFGEVLSIDTVNRCWQVRFVGSDEWCYVGERQLAGVEDITKRHGILAYSPAPETSTELEAAATAAAGLSVGHLILGLRWCHETHMEFGSQPSTSRLAEALSALLGVEISLHNESKRHQSVRMRQPDVSDRLAAQFLDLYGEEPELGLQFGVDDAPPFALRREGRLKMIMAKGAWDAIRQQLHGEMRQASMDIEAKRSARRSRNMDVDYGWFASGPGNIRRTSSSSSSLFRGSSL